MELKLEKGSPADLTGRFDKEKRCYELLDKLGLTYYRCDHPDANANTMEDCREIDAVLEAQVCKNLFLCNRQRTEFYLLMMPGDKPFKTKELPPQIGSARLSFAPEEYMVEYLDIHPGAVSVMGLMNDKENRVQLLMDRDLLQKEYLGCHPCINTSSIKLTTKDLLEKFLPAVHHGVIYVDL